MFSLFIRDICLQIPDTKSGENLIDVVLVDEEAVGSGGRPGLGAKIVRGNGELEPSIYQIKSRNMQVCFGVLCFPIKTLSIYFLFLIL